MYRVMVFPFLEENVQEIEGVYLRTDCELAKLVSLPGWHTTMEYLIHGKYYAVEFDFQNNVQQCDIVWFCENRVELSYPELCAYVLYALSQKKKIWMGKHLQSADLEGIKSFDPTGKYLHIPKDVPADSFHLYQRLSTPVVAVGGFSRDMGKLGIEVALTLEFKALGISPLLITSRPDGEFWGHYGFPSFFFDCTVPENDKVMALNYFFARLEHLEKPDVFIVGMPGALLPNDIDYFYDFGVLSFQIAQAIEIDEIIMSYPCLGTTEDFFEKMESRSQALLGTPISFHNLINKVIDRSNSRETEHFNFTTVNKQYVEKQLMSCRNPHISSLYTEEAYISRICKEIVEKYR